METILTEVRLRDATADDSEAIAEVLLDAFPSGAEAELVEALMAAKVPCVSVVAELDDEIVGHVLFTPVERVADNSPCRGAGLAPLAVMQAFQRRGVGTALVGAGLSRCRALGYPFVVVLGSSRFYSRFGFRPASEMGVTCQLAGSTPAFMALELVPDSLAGEHCEIRYHSAFAGL